MRIMIAEDAPMISARTAISE